MGSHSLNKKQMDTKKLRQKILDLAIHGKLVPQDPNDEPASVLLERIRAEKERLVKEGKIKKSKASKTSDTPHYENVPFEVPSSWEWVKFGIVCKKLTDGSHNPPPKKPIGYTVISAQNIKKGKIVFTEKDRYTDDIGFNKENPRTKISKGDIILGIIGGSIGNVGIFNHDKPVIAQRSVSIIDSYVSNLYCFYLLQSPIFQSLFVEKSIGNAQAGVYLGELEKLIIPLPPLAEQIRIVAEIEKLFALIDEIEQGKTNLQTSIKQSKSKILDLAIHGKLVPQDPNDAPASELLKRINPKAEITCDNGQYGKMPEGWCETILGELFEHNTGKALNSSNQEGVMRDYLTTSNVYWDTFDLSVVKQMLFKENELEKCTVVKGDLLVCEGGDVGRSAIWNQDYDICIQNHLHRLRPKAELSVRFYYHVLKYLKDNNMIGGKGIGLLGLSSKELHKLPFPLPPYNEQQRIVNKIEELFTLLDNIQKSLEV